MLRSSSELLGSELQALLSPYKSAACWRESPLLRSFEVKNSELWLQMGPASAVCGELGLPSLERGNTVKIWRVATFIFFLSFFFVFNPQKRSSGFSSFVWFDSTSKFAM